MKYKKNKFTSCSKRVWDLVSESKDHGMGVIREREREEVIWQIKLYYVGLCNVYALLNIIRLIKSRSTRLGGSYSMHSDDQKCKTDFRQKIWCEEHRSSQRWGFNMEREFNGIRWEGLHVILLAQDRDLGLLPQKAKLLWPYKWRTLPYQVSQILCTELQHKYRRAMSQTQKVCSSITQLSGPTYQSVLMFYLIFVGNLLPKHTFCTHYMCQIYTQSFVLSSVS